MAEVPGPPRAVARRVDLLEIEVVATDGVWTVTFDSIEGPASWADALYVWRAVARHHDGRRHVSLWAISGPLIASLRQKPSTTTVLELIVAEHRRRFEELRTQEGAKVVIDHEDYERL